MTAARKHREHATLTLNESDHLWLLVGLLDEAESPLALCFYILSAEYKGGSTWLVPSKSDPDDTKYEVDLDRNYCPCPFANHNHGCAHLRAMRFRSRLQFTAAK